MAAKKQPQTRNWIKGAIKHPGALRAKAAKKGLVKGSEKLSASDLKKMSSKGASSTTKRQVNLAKTLKKLPRRGKK
jgi:hypothetical protein